MKNFYEEEDESDEGEDEYDEPEPPSFFEWFANGAFEFGKGVLSLLVVLHAAEKVYNNNPVRALTSILADATFPKNEPEAHKQVGKMTVEEFLEAHKEKLFVKL